MKPQISVVLGSYNRCSFLKATIAQARLAVASLTHEIIVVDGGSTDGSLQWLTQQKDIITIVQYNRGNWAGKPIERRSWGYFMNLGFKIAKGKYILMISDDCLLTPQAVVNGLNYFEELLASGRKIGAMAFYWRNWPEAEQYWVGFTLDNKMFVNHGLFLRQALEEVDWIDEDHFVFYYADGDLCLKLWHKGYEVVDCPNAFVEHFFHVSKKVRSINVARIDFDRESLHEKWRGIYYFPEHPQGIEWVWLSPPVPYNTASHFPKWPVLRFRLIDKFTYKWARLRLRLKPLKKIILSIAGR